MPGPPFMSTCSEPNVRILPQANFAPGIAGNNPKCADLPSAAPPTHSVVTHAMRHMPAPPSSGSVSCHEKQAAVAVLRNSCAQNDILCAFSRQKRQELTAAVSCYESPCRYPVTRRPKNLLKLGQTGQNRQFDTLSIPCRFPISEEFAATLRHNTTLLGLFRKESAVFLPPCAASPTRKLTPRLTSTLISARAGQVARDEVLKSSKRPEAAIPPFPLLQHCPKKRKAGQTTNTKPEHGWSWEPFASRINFGTFQSTDFGIELPTMPRSATVRRTRRLKVSLHERGAAKTQS